MSCVIWLTRFRSSAVYGIVSIKLDSWNWMKLIEMKCFLVSCQWSALEAIQQLIRSGNLTGLDLSGCWTPEGSQSEGSHPEGIGAVNGSTLSGTSLAGSSSTGMAASSGDGVVKSKEEASTDAKTSEVILNPCFLRFFEFWIIENRLIRLLLIVFKDTFIRYFAILLLYVNIGLNSMLT